MDLEDFFFSGGNKEALFFMGYRSRQTGSRRPGAPLEKEVAGPFPTSASHKVHMVALGEE